LSIHTWKGLRNELNHKKHSKMIKKWTFIRKNTSFQGNKADKTISWATAWITFFPQKKAINMHPVSILNTKSLHQAP